MREIAVNLSFTRRHVGQEIRNGWVRLPP